RRRGRRSGRGRGACRGSRSSRRGSRDRRMIPPLAGSLSLSPSDVTNLEFVAVGLIAFLVFLVASRVIAHLLTEQLQSRQVRSDIVVLVRRVVYVAVIGLGIFLAFGLGLRNGKLTLVGVLLATVVSAFCVRRPF